jgi:hypothetical protein
MVRCRDGVIRQLTDCAGDCQPAIAECALRTLDHISRDVLVKDVLPRVQYGIFRSRILRALPVRSPLAAKLVAEAVGKPMQADLMSPDVPSRSEAWTAAMVAVEQGLTGGGCWMSWAVLREAASVKVAALNTISDHSTSGDILYKALRVVDFLDSPKFVECVTSLLLSEATDATHRFVRYAAHDALVSAKSSSNSALNIFTSQSGVQTLMGVATKGSLEEVRRVVDILEMLHSEKLMLRCDIKDLTDCVESHAARVASDACIDDLNLTVSALICFASKSCEHFSCLDQVLSNLLKDQKVAPTCAVFSFWGRASPEYQCRLLRSSESPSLNLLEAVAQGLEHPSCMVAERAARFLKDMDDLSGRHSLQAVDGTAKLQALLASSRSDACFEAASEALLKLDKDAALTSFREILCDSSVKVARRSSLLKCAASSACKAKKFWGEA